MINKAILAVHDARTTRTIGSDALAAARAVQLDVLRFAGDEYFTSESGVCRQPFQGMNLCHHPTARCTTFQPSFFQIWVVNKGFCQNLPELEL
jgi:hypothetical protein